MSTISILSENASWRSRNVTYYSGDWSAIQSVLPDFELAPFAAGKDEPENPFLRTVMRKPLSPVERPIPIGVVSHTYSLAPHRVVAGMCRDALIKAGVEPNDMKFEAGLSELGEWMNFRIYLSDAEMFLDGSTNKLALRLECFNSVDGSSRLVILFGWFRFVCANGLVIGETKIDIKERHGQSLDLAAISSRIGPALKAVQVDRERMIGWQKELVEIADIAAWADGKLSSDWGKKAAARVFHICASGQDVDFLDPFARGEATKKPIRYTKRVPGSPDRAATKYDVAQALSYVATRRKNAEERFERQAGVPELVGQLKARKSA